ncbi:MAG: SUF system NifU family Fe-S cluster assembly protein [Candidatus Zixiibacteriota bacterium]|nr:MAG: SUF system NifU family Fe-S cluster assembly protein [candidate division Zixibacteria bacterium]
MSEQLSDLYRDIIMEHYRFPRGKIPIAAPDITREGQNPACGDEIEIKVKMDGDKVRDISVDCIGCAISIASGSMLADMIRGKTLAEAKKIARIVKALLKGEEVNEDIELGDLDALRGVNKFPVRIKCAMLSWTTLVDAIEAEETGGINDVSTTE